VAIKEKIMGICPSELQHLVIRPTLEYLGEYSEDAETLLVATAAFESGMGFRLKGDKKRLGVFQISPQSHQHIWDHYLAKDPDLASKIRGLASQREFLSHPHAELATNLSYNTAIAWMIYKRKGRPLPNRQDLAAVAKYWRSHFHSRPQGSVEDFVKCYQNFIVADNNLVSSDKKAA
jgi:hypothetical protein